MRAYEQFLRGTLRAYNLRGTSLHPLVNLQKECLSTALKEQYRRHRSPLKAKVAHASKTLRRSVPQHLLE